MAPERLDENSGYTNFGGSPTRQGNTVISTGVFARFFSKFFSRKAKPAIAQALEDETPGVPNTTMSPPTVGDAVINRDLENTLGVGFGTRKGLPILTEQELNRKQRYREFEIMDEYPEIGASFDIYADDCTQKSLKGLRWEIKTDHAAAKEEINFMFEEIRLEDFCWDIVRNTVKYGDCFIELVPDIHNPREGIKKIKILNPNYLFRIEDEFGMLQGFVQQIPRKSSWETGGMQGESLAGSEFVTLDKDQIVHFRLNNSDPAFYPYGKSIAALARQTFRSLKLMEDAMLIYRLTRAPERRLFYIDIGNMGSAKGNAFIEKIKASFKKEKYYNRTMGNVDGRFNPISPDEDFYIPISGKKSNTKIEVLPGAQNLGEVDDVKYFRDKLLASLKIPKDYVVEKDQAPDRKANLSQLDAKFARVIVRVQRCIEIGLETIAQRHLKMKGWPKSIIRKLRVDLPEPSDMYIKRRMDVDEQKARVVQAVLGTQLFPLSQIYKDYYNMTDAEIDELKEKLQDEQQDEIFKQRALGMAAGGGMMGGGMGMDPGMGMPPGAPMADPTQGMGDMSPAENEPPTQQEQRVVMLEEQYRKAIKKGKVRLAEQLEKRIQEIKDF